MPRSLPSQSDQEPPLRAVPCSRPSLQTVAGGPSGNARRAADLLASHFPVIIDDWRQNMSICAHSDMSLAQIEAHKAQMGWMVPFVSSHGTSFAEDCGVGGGFMLSVFCATARMSYRTYCTTARGVDRLVFANSILDLTPYGRQEDW